MTKPTPKQYREMHARNVCLFFNTPEDAVRRIDYMERSGGFESINAFKVHDGENSGRWCVRAMRVDGMEA